MRRFKLMVCRQGSVETARALLQPGAESYGFEILREKGRLDLSMEALVIKYLWWTLFTDEEVATTQECLKAGGFSLR